MKNNTQLPTALDQLGESIIVHSVWPTIQGEGPFAGSPAVFVRLNGCNLQCPYCDTDYTSRGTVYKNTLDKQNWDIYALVRDITSKSVLRNKFTVSQKSLVVITGGEPFRQNIGPFVTELTQAGFIVQIETNGTLVAGVSLKTVIVCSPKTPQINPLTALRADAYKYVLDANHIDESDGLPAGTLGRFKRTARPPEGWEGTIYVQPLDEGDAQRNYHNLQACVKSVLRFGYKLSVQTHKIANLA